jgi:hypothetical protein
MIEAAEPLSPARDEKPIARRGGRGGLEGTRPQAMSADAIEQLDREQHERSRELSLNRLADLPCLRSPECPVAYVRTKSVLHAVRQST